MESGRAAGAKTGPTIWPDTQLGREEACWSRREQPAHQFGTLAEAPLLGGTHFHVREFGFDRFQHPRQRDGEREEWSVHLGLGPLFSGSGSQRSRTRWCFRHNGYLGTGCYRSKPVFRDRLVCENFCPGQSSEDVGGKDRGECAILLVTVCSQNFVQGTPRKSAAGQRPVDRGDAEGQDPMHRRCRALDPLDAFAELSEKGVFRAGPGTLCRPIGRDDRAQNPLALASCRPSVSCECSLYVLCSRSTNVKRRELCETGGRGLS
jgi:hypothetical protein